MIKVIAITEICTDGGTQQRLVDKDVMARYAELMKDGVKFPPVSIITDGKSNFLVDGNHRIKAAEKLNKTNIEANIEQGTQREAIWLSFSANKDSGFPRQPGTGKEIILKILADKEWAKTSITKIAEWVGVTRRYVQQIQADLKPAHPANSSQDRPQNQPKKEVIRSETLKVERKGKEYEMKPKGEPKVHDSVGQEVPKHLVDIFTRAREFKEAVNTLNEMQRKVLDGIKTGDKLYSFVKKEAFEAAIKNLKTVYRFGLPYAICPYCAADHSETCKACNGHGFITERIYETTPKDLKK